mgnify:CR=1 FL=1
MKGKQLPAIVHPITDTYPNIKLASDHGSVEAAAVNVCAPILLFAALQDDEEIKKKMDDYGIRPDDVNKAASTALEMFKSFMGFE